MKLITKDKLLFGLPIEIKNMGTIYQPRIKDFLDKDFNIQKFIRAFNIKANLFLENAEGVKNFDIFIYQLSLNLPTNELLVTELIESLKLLYRTDKVELIMKNEKNIESICISIEVIEKGKKKTYYLNRDNYDDFANIILILLDLGNNTKDTKLNEELNEIDLKIAQRKAEFEKRKAERESKLNKEETEEITMYDLMNYIIHADNSQFDYQNILELTIYQIKNTFNMYRQKESYNLYMQYKTSGQFKMDEDIVHWFFNK
jgi:hypothetical protein